MALQPMERKRGFMRFYHKVEGFPKLGGTILGVPIIRTVLGSPYLGKLPHGSRLGNLSMTLFLKTALDSGKAGFC